MASMIESQPSEPPELYPNSPLIEVVFEIRFAGEPAVECRRDEYFELVRSEFPKVLVPNAEPGKAPSLQPYQFRSDDDSEAVLLAINQFAYSTKRYPGFTAFRQRVRGVMAQFCQMFKITELRRTGLRYINAIPFVREHDDAVPWARYFTVALTLPGFSPDDFVNVNLGFVSRTPDGLITTRIACAKSQQNRPEHLVLDFDFVMTGPLECERLASYLDTSHSHTKRLFEKLVSDDYKAVMRGEGIE